MELHAPVIIKSHGIRILGGTTVSQRTPSDLAFTRVVLRCDHPIDQILINCIGDGVVARVLRIRRIAPRAHHAVEKIQGS